MARPQDGVENSAAFSRKDWPGSRPFWRGKRVLVTGGNGFLGRFIVGKLRERGASAARPCSWPALTGTLWHHDSIALAEAVIGLAV